ncbi:hypothetical protein ACFRU3_34200 [Streptomyces sp. NPDC056910]
MIDYSTRTQLNQVISCNAPALTAFWADRAAVPTSAPQLPLGGP